MTGLEAAREFLTTFGVRTKNVDRTSRAPTLADKSTRFYGVEVTPADVVQAARELGLPVREVVEEEESPAHLSVPRRPGRVFKKAPPRTLAKRLSVRVGVRAALMPAVLGVGSIGIPGPFLDASVETDMAGWESWARGRGKRRAKPTSKTSRWGFGGGT